MVIFIEIYNKQGKVIKMIGCKLERLSEMIEKNKSLIENNQSTIKTLPQLIEDSWNKTGTTLIEEEFDGINSPKIEKWI